MIESEERESVTVRTISRTHSVFRTTVAHMTDVSGGD